MPLDERTAEQRFVDDVVPAGMPLDLVEAELRERFRLDDGPLMDLLQRAEGVEVATASTNGAGARSAGGDQLPVVSLADFVARRDTVASIPLVGRAERALLPRGGLVVVGGVGGSSKTTYTLDALAHFASGTPWRGLELGRPLRVVIIDVEGPREPLRQKFERKLEVWQGPPFAENAYILDGPEWGRFSFAAAGDRARLRNTCTAHAIDLVACNPVGRLGMEGGGTPEEVGRFLGWLRDCGLWHDVAFWLIHHFNRGVHRDVLLRLSGAWDRDADTIIGLAREGQTTKVTWAKFRWALDGGPADEHEILEWDIPTLGYRHIEPPPPASAEEVRGRVRDWLEATPGWHATSAVRAAVTGDNSLIDRALRDLFEQSLARLSVDKGRSDLQTVAEEQWSDWQRLRTPKHWQARSHAGYQSLNLLTATDSDPTAPTPGGVPVAESLPPRKGSDSASDCHTEVNQDDIEHYAAAATDALSGASSSPAAGVSGLPRATGGES
jgi:hypothetical protein